MIEKTNSIANILDSIISRVEIELEQKPSLHTSQSEPEDVTTSKKRNQLSCDSVEDINCRICYDPNQDLPIIYPCKCKVRENSINKNNRYAIIRRTKSKISKEIPGD